MPAMAGAVGFVPGCGPTMVATALYLDWAILLTAQLGKASSKDGDALSPAIARASNGTGLATLCSAIPALLAAYGLCALGW